MNTRKIALAVVFAALYYTLGTVFQPISFMAVQFRVAQVLIPLIVVFGDSAVVGITVGHLLFNLQSPIGFLDLFSPFVLLIPRLLLWKGGLKFLPVHIVSVSLWVGYILNAAFNLPLLATAFTVGIGEAVAEGLGIPISYAVKRRLNL
jgi:uncharacterized membrane protein